MIFLMLAMGLVFVLIVGKDKLPKPLKIALWAIAVVLFLVFAIATFLM